MTVSVEVKNPRPPIGPFGGGWQYKAAVMVSRKILRIEFLVIALMVKFDG